MTGQLLCDEVVFRYRSGWRLGPLSSTLDPGVTAIVGPNGAGKTTLLRMLAGVRRPHAGRLVLGGTPVASEREWSEYRRRVGYLPQHSTWLSSWSVREFVGYVASAYGIPRARREPLVERALTTTSISDLAGTRLGELSGGQSQRVFLAAALVHEPEVLILDEPTVGLDPAERVRFRATISELAHERVVVLSTHLMDDVALTARNVVLVDEGRLAWQGRVAEVLEAGDDAASSQLSRAESGYLKLLGRSR